MFRNTFYTKFLLAFFLSSLLSCDDDERASLREKIDYSQLTSETPYSSLFVDKNGAPTVDLTEGNNLHRMFQALNYYNTSSVAANAAIDADVLDNLFTNTSDPFTDISTPTITVIGSQLNASGLNLRDNTASSLSAAEAESVRSTIQSHFDDIDAASAFVNQTASQGVAGKLGSYLVDERGIEIAQVIQKSLIGALQLDYISNVLLDEGLTADNYSLVSDKAYTALEHNWDVAYGLLTLNQIYLQGATDDNRNTIEFGLGAYLWEYNKTAYPSMYEAFLKGRAAIVNNDRAEYTMQATLIRTELEKALASAALGYLEKWKTGTTDAARAHAIAEGIGFIYSLRFCEVHEANAAFSDSILATLIGSANGFWDLDAGKINSASDAIRGKFNL